MLRNLLFILTLGVILSACEKSLTSNPDTFADQTMEEISLETRSGPSGCYELVFPIDLELPDGSVITAESFEDARAQVKAWKEANPDVEGKVKLVFPLEMINEDGELITVSSVEELREIRKECLKEKFQNKAKPCFRLVFPISVEFPNGAIVTFENRHSLKHALRQWKKNHPFSNVRPELVFPLEVEMKEDGTIITVNNKEELKQLKEDCE